MSEETCELCGEKIGMHDYRSFGIFQIQDCTFKFVFVHLACEEMDADHQIIRLLEDKEP